VKLNYFVAPDKRKIKVMNSNVVCVVVVFTDYVRKRSVKLFYRNCRESGMSNRTENVGCLFCQNVDVSWVGQYFTSCTHVTSVRVELKCDGTR
jgi:hypothetical protein